jgi:hypothetical protein
MFETVVDSVISSKYLPQRFSIPSSATKIRIKLNLDHFRKNFTAFLEGLSDAGRRKILQTAQAR